MIVVSDAMFKGIDLYSDTLTKPTTAMKMAMLEAEVGDEQKGEDPTTLRLENTVAELLGHECALFFPSATMANEIAIQLHCHRGDELMAAHNAHVFFAEAGGPAIHAGVMAKPILTETGIFSGDDVENQYRFSKGPHYPVTKLVSVENTTNMGGGVPWPIHELESVLNRSKSLGLKTHLDGSRLFNAVVRLGISPKTIASRFDTVTICLSKGLGCPTGALLAFSKEHFEKVRRLKQLMGGALRQSGILAAAGIYALTHHINRLEEDHKNAENLASLLQDIKFIRVENPTPPTNMVFFRWEHPSVSTEHFLNRCEEKNLRFSQVGKNRVRAVTHLDIKPEDVMRAFSILKEEF